MSESEDCRRSEEAGSRFRIGYALPARKINSFMLAPFINHAKERGIDFVPIDPSIPLSRQGPFDCVIHKLYGLDWKLNLEDFLVKNPSAVIIDPPSAIERLCNRIFMLESVNQLNIPRLSIPTQILLPDAKTLMSLGEIKFPVIAKPLISDGSTKSHKMKLVLSREGLRKGFGRELETPVVLQQFVNHGGVIYKVYVADDYVKCVKRNSLKDISEEELEKISTESGGILCFSQISNTALITAGDHDIKGKMEEEEERMPEKEFVEEVAKGLRKALGLHLFNFDMIKENSNHKDGDEGSYSSSYLVIDINYFPGYEKLPHYESLMTDFFFNAITERKRQMEGQCNTVTQ